VRWETDIVDGPLVRADGIGIAPDEQAHIFDRF
jgi:signal transduction histidine kinase